MEQTGVELVAAGIAAAAMFGVLWNYEKRRRKRRRRAERRRRNLAYERAWNMIFRKHAPRLTYRADDEG